MRRQKCNQCGTMLDVSDEEKGTKIACANCGTILVVGEATVVKRSLKEGGPAFQPKSGKGEAKAAPAPARSRHKRAQEPRGPKEPKEPREPREPNKKGAEKKKSRLPLVLGLGVLVLGGGIALALSLGDQGGSGGGGGSTETAQEWWATGSPLLAKPATATLRGWIEEAGQRGYDQDSAFWGPRADRLDKALLAKSPGDPDANERSGRRNLRAYPKFAKAWQAMNDNFRALTQEQKDFLDRYTDRVDARRQKPVWIDADEYAAAKKILYAFVESHEGAASSPAAAKIQKGLGDASAILGKDYGFVAVADGPFIVLLSFVKGEGGEDAKKDLEAQARRYAAALRVFQKEFDTRFRKPLGLPAVAPGRYFYHLVVAKQADLDRFLQRGEGYDTHGHIPAFFSARTKWSHAYVDAEKPNLIAGDLAHEATHQLHWFYSRDRKLKALYHFDRWNGLWFSEGWAEYLGGGLDFDAESGKTGWTGVPPRRVQHLKNVRDNGLPLYPLRELVQFDSMDTVTRQSFDAYTSNLGGWENVHETARQFIASESGFYIKTFYAQCWYLAYFLNHYSDGKYRERYLDLVRTALSGKAKPEKYRKDRKIAEHWGSAFEAFVDIFGLKSGPDWQRMEREMKGYLPTALRKG